MAKKKKDDLIRRSVTLPVVGVLNGTWQEFKEACKQAWNDSTMLANWAMSRLYINDTPRKPDDEKLSKMDDVYLYGIANKKYWGWSAWKGCCASAQSLMKGIDLKYRAIRFQLLWCNNVSLPTFRYPYPYPVHNQCWKAYLEDGNQVVEFTMKGRLWKLALRKGPELTRQMCLFAKMVKGEWKKGELAVYRKGFREKHVMVKMVACMPKPEMKSGHTVLIRTHSEHFWISEAEGRQPWIVNADQIKRWVDNHRFFLQRISEDKKRDKHVDRQARRNMEIKTELRCEKNKDRIDTFCHTVTRQLVDWVVSIGVREVIYDDRCEEYLPRFPWHKVKTRIAYKLEELGIAFTHRGGTDNEDLLEGETCPIKENQQEQERLRMAARMVKRVSNREAYASSGRKGRKRPGISAGGSPRCSPT